MIKGLIGVAISTTGDEHRLGFLAASVEGWRRVLPLGSVLLVTVDGDEAALDRAHRAADPTKYGNVYRVGQRQFAVEPYASRLGVAVNKNTGIELLMDYGVEHLFLSDDDTYPLSRTALAVHASLSEHIPHTMICWGKSRNPTLIGVDWGYYAAWSWPRGVLLYARRSVIERVGGMDERFGLGGHEHAEWSRRIHQAGLTPAPFCTPAIIATEGPGILRMDRSGHAARRLWHCEDMPRFADGGRERLDDLGRRRRKITSLRRSDRNWGSIEKIMAERDGDTSFVPYRASENGRTSATMWKNLTSRGAEGLVEKNQ